MLATIPQEYFQIFRRVRDFYRPDLPYHNFPHGVRTAIHVIELSDRCERYGIPVDRQVAILTAVTHDMGMGMPGREGFQTDEAFASHSAAQLLTELGLPSSTIVRVQQAILSTHRDATFTSVEEKLVRAADLASLAGPYEVFLDNTMKLRREREILTGRPCFWQEWKHITRKVVEFYLSQDIRITPLHDDERGVSSFHQHARRNLETFLCEPEELLDLLCDHRITSPTS